MFAAYAGKGDGEKSAVDNTKTAGGEKSEWLTNSSFTIESPVISNIQGVGERSGRSFPLAGPSSNKIVADDGVAVKTDGKPDRACSPVVYSLSSSSSASTPVSICSPCTPPSPGSPRTPDGSPARSNSPSSGDERKQGEEVSTLSPLAKHGKNIVDEPSRSKYSEKSRRSRSRSRRSSRSPERRQRRSSDRSRSISRSRKSRERDDSRFRRRRRRSRSHSRRRSRSKSKSRTDASRNQKRAKESRRRRRKSSGSSRSSSLDSSSETHGHGALVRSKGPAPEQSKFFYEDKIRAFGNLSVSKLSRPAVAWYRPLRRGLGIPKNFSFQSKRHTLKHRYYNKILKELEADVMTSRANKEKDSKEGKNVGQVQGNVNDVEEEILKVTAKFNQDLSEDPNNIDSWRKYVQFQDVVYQFEKVYRRGGGATGARVTAERKLSILDKALKENPLCEELLKERCQLAESVLPSDKLTAQLKTYIGTDPGNLVLWEALIMASQGSLSVCKVPVVKSIYQEALTNIHSQRRGNADSAKTIDAKLIDLILHLGLFLRQAGLLELMWSLISVYLEFNLAKLDPTKFHITNTVADNALTELEEAILGSQLPLSTLWLRVEALRAGTHWVPLPADADSEDPQRLVFPEDVNDLIHPIHCPQFNFRLVTVTLFLLKVPILPWRECAAKAAGLHSLPWLLDGPEPLYAALLPLGTLEFKQTSDLLMDAAQLCCGPQYLISRPGQDEYIDFLTQVFSTCSDCLPPSQRTFLQVWWLRFYRWLMQLEHLGHCKLPKGRRKKMRATAKDLLRQESNRSNFVLFKEFALLELENGSVDGAKKVLQGSISALPITKPVPIAQDRAYICALYRVLVEVHLSHSGHQGQTDSNELIAENRNKAMSLLVSLGRGTPFKNEKPTSTDIAGALSKFNHIIREALDKPAEEELDPYIAPDVCHLASTFLVEWAACHGWLLFLSHSIWKAAAMFENLLSELKVSSTSCSESSSNNTSSTHENFIKLQREALFETYISFLRHHCFETRGSFVVLREAIVRGLKEFPGNLTFAAALADLETNSSGTGLPLWRLSKMFYDLNSAPAYGLFVFVMKYRLKQQESATRATQAVLNQGGPELPDPNIRNRLSTLLKKLTKHPVMRRCPLLWRLRLQFVAAFSSSDAECSSTFYLALEDCPWAKALYMDIVQVLPTQLDQVQDLLVEKELRLHVTPEELHILRVDT